ncbi:MAG TPA: hypothetical protein VEV43_10345 [Actinomycetota bacterium]|nr:hypothetical protein [Actinomycetota bacterium]
MRATRLLTVAVLAGVTLTSLLPRAEANYFGPVDGCCEYADNAEHTVYYEIVGNQSYRDAFDHIVGHLDNATVMTTKKVDTKTSATDVRMIADYVGGSGFHGEWDCTALNSAGECETAKLTLNRGSLDGAGQHNKDKVACHEMGHSVGLDHAYQISSCMEQGLDGPPRFFADHDKTHINNHY